jgi:hypothetical protein
VSDSFELIYHDLNIENNRELSEDQWLEIITDRVSWLLENDKDLLLSYLYRLDIEEQKIDKALTPFEEDPAHIGLAKLILDRQKQRIATKQKYKVDPIEGWEY